MNVCATQITRRCRPLLGTFVEITVESQNPLEEIHAAVNAAFAAVERVHNQMSFHDPASDVSRLNRLAARESLSVGFETYAVLKCAQELHERTGGIFDITIAPELMDQGLLPRHEFLAGDKHEGSAKDIELGRGLVRFRRPLCIDLGGIAKGFAVDKAVRILQLAGIETGCVNAGGDLRCFGRTKWPCWVRHPQDPRQLVFLLELQNAALATSANSGQPCAHIHGRTRKTLPRPFSVSVSAASCMYADALTKIVLALEKESAALLSLFHARSFIIHPNNQVFFSEKSA